VLGTWLTNSRSEEGYLLVRNYREWDGHWIMPGLDTAIYKYMEITKFLSLIQKNALYLSRISKLADPFEGTLTKQHAAYINSNMPGGILARKRMRENTFVSCWFSGKFMSNAMWQIYGLSAASVMIKSSVGRLLEALPRLRDDDHCHAGMVKYTDYEAGHPQFARSNRFGILFTKSVHLAFEEEFRLAVWSGRSWTTTAARGWKPKGSSVSQVGLSIPVDIPTLIEEVTVNPGAENWVHDVIEASIKCFSPDIPLRKIVMVPIL